MRVVRPRARVKGARHGGGLRGLSKRVVYGKQVLIKHLRGTHVIVYGGGQKQHRG